MNKAKVVEEHQVLVSQVDGTPFAIVERDNEVRVVIGQMLATEINFESKAKAEEYINEKPWPLIMSLAYFISKHHGELTKEQNE